MNIKTFKNVCYGGIVFITILIISFLNSFSLKELSISFIASVPNLKIQISFDSLQRSDNILSYTLYNNKYNDIYCTGETILVYLDGSEWKEVLDKMKRSYNEQLYTLTLSPIPTDDLIYLQLNLSEYGKLRSGKYKIIMPLYDRNADIILYLASNSFEV